MKEKETIVAVIDKVPMIADEETIISNTKRRSEKIYAGVSVVSGTEIKNKHAC